MAVPPTDLAPDVAPDILAGEHAPERPLRPGQLTEGWRWILTLGWAALLPALMALGDTAHSFGKPTWWLDFQAEVAWWTPLPFLPVLAVAVAASANWRRWPWIAVAGVATLAGSAVVDSGRSPGVAIGEAACALAAVAVSGAALTGRVRRSPARADR